MITGSHKPAAAHGGPTESAGGRTMSRKEAILAALAAVRFPGLEKSIAELGYIKSVNEETDPPEVLLEIATPHAEAAAQIERDAREALARSGVAATLSVSRPGSGDRQPGAQRPLIEDLAPAVRHKIVVASGKGGVGKSTVAVNLALALAARGRRVGLLDADIYGPSVPTMLGVAEQRPEASDGKLVPIAAHGIQAVSLGFLTEGLSPIIWRGPLASRAIEQLLGDVDWSAVDDLVLDLPPGTGDIQISIAQKANPSGAVIVTTPQDVALIDAIRGVHMFRKVEIPVLGVVENMSRFVCPHCRQESVVFPQGALHRELERLEVPLLGSIPIDPAVAAGGDRGEPIVSAAPESPAAAAYQQVAARVAERIAPRPTAAQGPR
jgi:ATP-binding protein involved in chromosome partitioning